MPNRAQEGARYPAYTGPDRQTMLSHWLEHSILHLVDAAATGNPGSEAMLAKLSEALFVDALRRYIGWVVAIRSRGTLHAVPFRTSDVISDPGATPLRTSR